MNVALAEMLRTETLLQVDISQTITSSYSLTVTELSGTTIAITFGGIANRQPALAHDQALLWQNPNVVPWGVVPLSTTPIVATTPNSDQLWNGLSLASLPYVAAYSVGNDPNGWNIAAVAPFGVGLTIGPTQVITVNAAYVGTNSLAIAYTTPAGTKPKSFGHQVALVHNQGYSPSSRLIKMTTPTDNSTDFAVFNGVTMTMGQYFTAAYLAGSDPMNVAATVSFQVASPSGGGTLNAGVR